MVGFYRNIEWKFRKKFLVGWKLIWFMKVLEKSFKKNDKTWYNIHIEIDFFKENNICVIKFVTLDKNMICDDIYVLNINVEVKVSFNWMLIFCINYFLRFLFNTKMRTDLYDI